MRLIRFLKKLFCIALIHVACEHQHNTTQNKIDFSSLEVFWEIHDMLAQDLQPSAGDWDRLLSSPCYDFLNQDSFYKRLFVTAFQPKNQHILDSALSKNNYYAGILRHLTDISKNRVVYKNYQNSLTNFKIEEALLSAQEFLPDSAIYQHQPPTILIGVFNNDGYSYDEKIVIDLGAALNLGFVGFAGHEFHHFYASKLSRINELPEDNPYHFGIKIIRQLQHEGIADLIDKEYPLDDFYSKSVDSIYNHSFEISNQILAKVDSTIRSIENSSDTAEIFMQAYKLLPMGGHPNGHFMTKVILKEYGKDSLIATLENPLDFFRIYNDVASLHKDSLYLFSNQTMQILETIEKLD